MAVREQEVTVWNPGFSARGPTPESSMRIYFPLPIYSPPVNNRLVAASSISI